MLYREIMDEARRLPLHERLQLVEELLRDIRQSERPASRSRRKVRPMSELRGALKLAGELPTDTELREMYTDHLLDKYL
jgi:hypothetical protein